MLKLKEKYRTIKTKEQTLPAKRSYSAGKISRLTNDWSVLQVSPNKDIFDALKNIRQRARELTQNDPYAKKFLQSLKKNVIGPNGFTLRVKAQLKGVADKDSGKAIQTEFYSWEKKKYCSFQKDLSFRELCGLAVTTIARDGEVFIKKVRGRSVNKYGYTLQMVEPELVDETLNKVLANGNVILMGVEMNQYRQVQAYWFKKNPLENELNGLYTNNYDRVPADQVYHLFAKEYINQIRGISWFAPVAMRMKMLQGYEEAALVNARASAMLSGKLTPKFEGETIDAERLSAAEDEAGDLTKTVEPGEILNVPYGYDYDTIKSEYPQMNHDAFTQGILRGVASGFDISYISLANNYANVNYTSSRTNLLDERDTWKTLQSWFIEHYLEDVYEDWLQMLLITGITPFDISDYDRLNHPVFMGRRWDWVSPKDEAEANKVANENNQKTLEDILAEKGEDLEETLEQLKYERERLIETGLYNE